MDPTHRLSLIYQSAQPPPPPSSSGASLPIFAVFILGVITTTVLLLNYYAIVIKCCRRSGRSSTQRHNGSPTTVHTAPDEPPGLDPSAIRAIPVVRFSKSGGSEAKRSSSSHECAVCLNEFSEEESLRLLPNCSHIFHVDCIDTWLQSNANCPLCRSGITNPTPAPFPPQSLPRQEHVGSVVIEVGGDGGGDDRAPRGEASSPGPNPSPRRRESSKKRKRMHQVSSMGDECADSSERWLVRPGRRSFSVDSCCDRRLHVAVQEMLQQNPVSLRGVGSGEGSSGAGGGGRLRRSFFSFGHGRSPREAVLPIQIGL